MLIEKTSLKASYLKKSITILQAVGMDSVNTLYDVYQSYTL